MAQLLLLATVAAPLGLLPLAGGAGLRGAVVLAGAALPAVAAALLVPPGTALGLPWLLLGDGLALDATGQSFLLLSGLLWAFAGVYAAGTVSERRGVFQAAWLIVMAGNLVVVLAAGPALFLAGFAALGLGGYPLVAHYGTADAQRAANRYLALVALGEAVLFTGLVAVATSGAGGPAGWAVAALVAGFGIKAGLVPLHVWLPLAHPVAPAAASAVLSGALVKAGLLGWLRYLPLGDAAWPAMGEALAWLGLTGAFLAVALGLLQDRAKVALAYSTVSQMGWLAFAVGVGLSSPTAWAGLEAGVALFALHHGVAKGGLFLAAGSSGRVASRTGRLLAVAGLVIPAAALAGLPFTTGGAAKEALKSAVYDAGAWSVSAWLAWGSAATTLLVIRAVYLAWPGGTGSGLTRSEGVGWAGLVVAGPVLAMAWPAMREAGADLLAEGHALSALLPVGGAVLAAAAARALLVRWRAPTATAPPGDVLVFLEMGGRWLLARLRGGAGRWVAWWVPANRLWAGLKHSLWDPWRYRVFAADRWGWLGSGTAFLAVALALLALLTLGG